MLRFNLELPPRSEQRGHISSFLWILCCTEDRRRDTLHCASWQEMINAPVYLRLFVITERIEGEKLNPQRE